MFLEEKEKKRLAEQKRDEALRQMGVDGCPKGFDIEQEAHDRVPAYLWPKLQRLIFEYRRYSDD